MGAVDLLMELEEIFDIEISDEAAENTRTVGELQALVLSLLAENRRPQDAADVYERIKRILIEFHGIPEARIRPEATFFDDLGLD